MDIRKVDSKGRVSVGNDQTHYSVTRHEDGSISLQPLPDIPVPPKMDKMQLRAVYVDPSPTTHIPPTVTIFSQMPNQFEFIARIAEDCKVPIVVNDVGVGAAWVDRLAAVTDQPVIARYPGKTL